MKIKITYKYKPSHYYPFIAIADLEGEELSGSSDKSFDLAKAELIRNLNDVIETKPTIIPETEEVEL